MPDPGRDRSGRLRRARRATSAAYDPAAGVERRVDPVAGPTQDDTEAGWGERPDESVRDRWLREQRPPHWE